MNIRVFWIVSLGLSACLLASRAQADSPAPKSILPSDGFPQGLQTPEGAACDFARAFIQHNPDLLKSTCLDPYGGADTKKTYTATLDRLAVEMKKDQASPSPKGPKSIGKCFAARHLSRGGPVSYAYAVFGWQDVMFVDVGTFSQDGSRQLCRTLVIETKPSIWKVDPSPDLSPLLSAGLNDEPRSTVDFSSAPQSAKADHPGTGHPSAP